MSASLEQLIAHWREKWTDYLLKCWPGEPSRGAFEQAMEEVIALVLGPPPEGCSIYAAVEVDFKRELFRLLKATNHQEACSAVARLLEQPAVLGPPQCDCGEKLTVCANCAVSEWQGDHPDCKVCCPLAALGHAGSKEPNL